MRTNRFIATPHLALTSPALTSLALGLALCAAGCSFRSPGAGGDGSPIDAAIDSPTDGASNAWLQPWTHRKPITLLASEIEAPRDDSLIDFPVLVSITDAELAASAQPDGADIVFTSANGTTLLASELESFTKASGQLVAWVKVPNLSATTNTTLYVYYGRPNPPPPSPPQDVWTANYLAVWHLHQDPGPNGGTTILDATRGNHHGTADNQFESTDSVPARIGRGIRFDGTQEFINFTTMDFGNTFTISMWVNFAGATGIKMLLANSASGRDTDGFRFFVNGTSSDRRVLFETGSGPPGTGRVAETGPNAISDNSPAHVAITVDRPTATAFIYVNGRNLSIVTTISSTFRTSSDFELGRAENGLFHFPGTLDEVQVSSTLRSPEWLVTSFRNQSQPDTFHTLGPEENP
jgi:hypothetical protein